MSVLLCKKFVMVWCLLLFIMVLAGAENSSSKLITAFPEAPKGNIPYIVIKNNQWGDPLFGFEYIYKVKYSDNFPFDKARIKFSWRNGSSGSSCESKVDRKNKTFRFGFCAGQSGGNTTLKYRFGNSGGGNTFSWKKMLPNLALRDCVVLTPDRTVTFAALGLKILPPESHKNGTYWAYSATNQVWYAVSRDKLPNMHSLQLTLIVDNISCKDLPKYNTYAVDILNKTYPELTLLRIPESITSEQKRCLGLLHKILLAQNKVYTETQNMYNSGSLPLSSVLEVKNSMDKTFIKILDICGPRYKELRQETVNGIAANMKKYVELRKFDYDSGSLSLSEFQEAKIKYLRFLTKNKLVKPKGN